MAKLVSVTIWNLSLCIIWLSICHCRDSGHASSCFYDSI